ncbi:MAG TPA: PaaI family thioesterase [Methanoregulaceae archaeon]|nr:PaaI family thioesterase [Methanoregulaceae archaeon]
MDAETARVVTSFDDCGFARTLGLRVIAVEDGAVTVAMDGEGTFNRSGAVHGGAIFALADHAFGCAANLAGHEVTLAAEISYLSPATGPLTATARRAAVTPTVSLYRVEVRQGDRLIALFSGHGFRLGEGSRGLLNLPEDKPDCDG